MALVKRNIRALLRSIFSWKRTFTSTLCRCTFIVKYMDHADATRRAGRPECIFKFPRFLKSSRVGCGLSHSPVVMEIKWRRKSCGLLEDRCWSWTVYLLLLTTWYYGVRWGAKTVVWDWVAIMYGRRHVHQGIVLGTVDQQRTARHRMRGWPGVAPISFFEVWSKKVCFGQFTHFPSMFSFNYILFVLS